MARFILPWYLIPWTVDYGRSEVRTSLDFSHYSATVKLSVWKCQLCQLLVQRHLSDLITMRTKLYFIFFVFVLMWQNIRSFITGCYNVRIIKKMCSLSIYKETGNVGNKIFHPDGSFGDIISLRIPDKSTSTSYSLIKFHFRGHAVGSNCRESDPGPRSFMLGLKQVSSDTVCSPVNCPRKAVCVRRGLG